MALDALSYLSTRSPVKVSVVFAIGILLPAVFLGALGVRSYRFEDRLMHKEADERFAAVADLIENKLTERLSTLIVGLRALAGQTAPQSLDYAQIMPYVLTRTKLGNLMMNGLFVFDDAERMVAPWPADSKRAVPMSARREVDWGPIADEIEHLERLEFVDKNVEAALRGYAALQSQRLSPPIQAALLKTIAGDYRKLKQNRLAAAAYLQLAAQHEQLQDFSGLPTGVLGRQTAYTIYEQEKSWNKALDVQLDLYEGLLLRRWNLTDRQRTTLLSDLRGAMARSLTHKSVEASVQKPRWERLQSMQTRLGALSQAGERFATTDWPDLIRRLHQLGRLDQGAVIEITTKRAPQVAIVVPILTPQTGRRTGILVALLPADTLWRTLNDVMVPLATTAGLKTEWSHGLSGSPGNPRLWTIRLERQVGAIDPPLRFHLVEADASTREQLFRRRQWIFGCMSSLSVIMLLFGLGMTFHAVKRETEIANLKSDFVATVSHELRTPLAAISSIGERLSLGRYRSDEERKEFYDVLGQETHRLRTLIEDILDFSKMLAGKKQYRREPLDLVALVQEAIETFEPKADSHGFEVAQELPSHPVGILGDATAIRQAVLNLLDNAMKYSLESRTIRVGVTTSPPNGLVAVTDQGVGIAGGDKAKIFEKFYRVERGRQGQSEGGVGLGLAMVKHVVKGHEGTIKVESRLGEGSTFTLVFPLAQGDRHA